MRKAEGSGTHGFGKDPRLSWLLIPLVVKAELCSSAPRFVVESAHAGLPKLAGVTQTSSGLPSALDLPLSP